MQHAFFPSEVVANVPRITMTGHELVHIEQHMGLADYEPEQIAIRTGSGLLRILGAGMVFKLYNAEEAVVVGQIDSVTFQPKEVGT